jgi:hypothetical protein
VSEPLSATTRTLVIESVESLKRMRRQPGWDAVARNVCIEALLAFDDFPPDKRLMTVRFIDYTLKRLKEAGR